MAANRYLTRQGLRNYLESNIASFFMTRDMDNCPISLHLTQMTNRTWHVSTLNCVPQVDAEENEDQFRLKHEFKPPKWAQRYIDLLDGRYDHQQTITGEEALYVLNEVT